MRLHHVQVACPARGEDAARAARALGLPLREVTARAEAIWRLET